MAKVVAQSTTIVEKGSYDWQIRNFAALNRRVGCVCDVAVCVTKLRTGISCFRLPFTWSNMTDGM